MFPSCSNYRYDHIQHCVIDHNDILESSLTHYSANTQESFILFTAYNIASQYSSAGQCQLTLGLLIPVSPVYSVSQPATVNPTEAQSSALDLFTSYIGFSVCSGYGGDEITASALSSLPAPSLIAASSLTPVTSGSNQNSTQSNAAGTNSSNNSSAQSVSTHSTGSSDKMLKIGLGVTIPVACLGLVLLGFLVYKRRKAQGTLKEEESTSQKGETPHEDRQPYLQQKGELEAEENRKHELEAQERKYEIGVEGGRYELPVEEPDLMIQTRQELRGEEHSTELL